jgi:prepilin-type N-terminal cleavage/methylation domain-containing protein
LDLGFQIGGRKHLQSRIPNLKSGFTLIELMLVVVITLLAAAIAVPSFVRSMRGAKLRASTRSVLMCHRYARSMAVLRQVNVSVIYYETKNEIEIVSESAQPGQDERAAFLDNRIAQEDVASPAAGSGQPSGESAGVQSEMIRSLPEGVKIAEFISERAFHYKEAHAVTYFRNGMCDPYTVRLEDENHEAVTIKVDPLSGRAAVENS